MLALHVADLAGTRAVAARLATLARPGDIIVLAGEMGAGKTRFAQGFARELGVVEPVTSPTFTLVHSYPLSGDRVLHHADLYRLDGLADVDDLALHELAEFGGIVLVEWGDVAAGALGDHLEVRLEVDDESAGDELSDDETSGDSFGLDAPRSIVLSASGSRWAARWDRINEAVAEFRDPAGGSMC